MGRREALDGNREPGTGSVTPVTGKMPSRRGRYQRSRFGVTVPSSLFPVPTLRPPSHTTP